MTGVIRPMATSTIWRAYPRCLSVRTRYNEVGFDTEAGLDARRYDIDLRSDTVTRPSAGMRAALAAAETGEDGYGGEPTVNRLQPTIAERVCLPSVRFFASAT